MGVKEKLLTVDEREDGGRTAYERFDYQTAWGISKLLDLHDAGLNYAVGFEFHDDVVSLDDADDPTKVIFYQVKTKQTGNWSFARIANRTTVKGVKQASFAGKMYDNFLRFGAVVERLVFVSNQPLPEVILVHGENGFSLAEKEKLKKFIAKLSEEAGGFKDPEHTSLFFFAFSELNLAGYENAILGRIASFLANGVGSHIPPKPFALMLNDYCRRRSKKLADFSSFDELKASKFVTRAEVTQWLTHICGQHERRPDWGSVSNQLNLPFIEKTKIQREWSAYEVAMRARPNAATVAMNERLRKLIDDTIDGADAGMEDLVAFVDAVFALAKPVVRAWKADASDHFVKAAILYEFSP
ncbi:DUF4297 domain-containing protein [Mesorhizobium sp. M0317]|uniref:dsDNA nuclease domain-containing protein n=1 Tax=Mesorhizobium sp. M0317 TaxID=2956935 RepID=UPI00333656E1